MYVFQLFLLQLRYIFHLVIQNFTTTKCKKNDLNAKRKGVVNLMFGPKCPFKVHDK